MQTNYWCRYLSVKAKAEQHLVPLWSTLNIYTFLQRCLCISKSCILYSGTVLVRGLAEQSPPLQLMLLCAGNTNWKWWDKYLKSWIHSEISSPHFTVSCVQWLHKFSTLSIDWENIPPVCTQMTSGQFWRGKKEKSSTQTSKDYLWTSWSPINLATEERQSSLAYAKWVRQRKNLSSLQSRSRWGSE